MSALRIPVAIITGALLSLAVFLGLWRLVGAPLDMDKPAEATVINFTPQIVERPVENKRDPKPERVPPTLTPAPAFAGPGLTSIGGATAWVRPEVGKIAAPRGTSLAGTDRDTLPLVRVPPDYPPGAESKGIEGWVQVQFTVAANGSVRDAFVVASEPRTIFDDAALKAIARWRYNPRIDGGVAVERVGLQTVIRFELTN